MKNLLLTLFMALAVLVFIMVGTQLFRLFDMLSKGVSPMLLCRMVAYILPDVLRYALPFSVMIAAVLVFSKMSAENEIVALKASGIGLWQIVAPGLAMSGVISLVCLYLTLYLAPEAGEALRRLEKDVLASENISAMLEPGKITRISDKFSIRVGRIESDVMYDVHCYIYGDGKSSAPFLNDIIAERGMFVEDSAEGMVKLVLDNFSAAQLPRLEDAVSDIGTDDSAKVLESEPDGHPLKERGSIEMPFLTAGTLVIPFSQTGDSSSSALPLVRKLKVMNINMLLGNLILLDADDTIGQTKHWAEIQARFALALAPFALFLIGVPFGIRSRRNETSVGLLICACLGIAFYAFQSIGRTFNNVPAMFPQYLVWLPVIIYQFAGIIAIHRISRH